MIVVEVVRCQRCGVEVIDMMNDPKWPRMTKRRLPLTGEYERDRYARWQNSYLHDDEDLICMNCLRADPIYKWLR